MLIKRIIQPFVIPLAEKIGSLHKIFEREGKKLNKEDINEAMINSI